MLDARRLEILVEVGRAGSLSAAAQALHLTQPAVSKQIALLERQTGLPLLHRTSRGTRLTEAGRTLVGHAQGVLDRLAAAESAMDDLAGLRAGAVRLGAFPSAFATLVPQGLRAFRRRWPAIHVDVYPVDPVPASTSVGRGELDIAITYDHPFALLPADPRLHRQALFDDPMLVALPHDHPLAASVTVRLADLRDESWVLSSTDAMALLVRHACEQAAFSPRVTAEAADPIAIEGLVAASVGITLLPTLTCTITRPDIVLRPLDDPFPVRRIHLTIAADQPSPGTDAMAQILAEVGARHARLSALRSSASAQ